MSNPTKILPQIIRERASASPGRILLEEIQNGRKLTYGEFHASTLRWAESLSNLGVTEKHTVATMFPTSILALECWLGVAWLGAIEVPLNNQYSGPMLASLINRSQARVMVVSQSLVHKVDAIADKLTTLEKVVVPDTDQALPAMPIQGLSQHEFFAETGRDRTDPPHYAPFGMVLTSGTTGPSKGVIVPWAELACAVLANFPDDDPADYDDGGYYCPWPLYNLLGKGAFDIAVRQGLRLVLRDRFSQQHFWSDVKAYRCTHAVLPFVGPWLWREPPSSSDSDNPLRRVVMVPVMSEHREFAERFGVKVSTAYATTEAGFAITTANPSDPASCGRAIPGFQLRVVDEHDELVAPGVLGELIARHDLPWRQMTEYFNDPVATAAAWRNGWYHTGDAMRYDEDGNFFFSGRMKDYLKHRGQNVSAVDLELQVIEHPDIIECACVGVPTELAGEGGFADEDIKLFVVKDASSTLTEHALHAWLIERLPRFMVPQFIEYIDVLPRGDLEKILKRDLRIRPPGGVAFARTPHKS